MGGVWGVGGKDLFFSSDEDSGGNDNDEPLREKQPVDVWLPHPNPYFITTCGVPT